MSDVQQIETHGRSLRVSVDPEPEQEGRPALWPSVGEYPIYDPFLYTTMTTDDERNQRFRTALSQLARAGGSWTSGPDRIFSGRARVCRREPGTP
ncbi:hypothetical protein [Streptomyces sp. NBC_00829]|uniref:hypothetical protein n=1 Tax=Streptomyces sp. NBC_00829 TaxID=2903679 RepID=UPI002F91AF6D|nr:hypothetical protein OG293_41195 [Streptomyces sp. NBC_00829]